MIRISHDFGLGSGGVLHDQKKMDTTWHDIKWVFKFFLDILIIQSYAFHIHKIRYEVIEEVFIDKFDI